MIKACFFDIDGTLVSLKKKVYPPSLPPAIDALRRKGILCYVATGRSRYEIAGEHLLDPMCFDGYLTNNGQDAYDGEGHQLCGISIDKKDAAAVLDWVEKTGCACWMVGLNHCLLNHASSRVEQAMAAIHTKLPPIGDLRPMLHEPIYKIVLFLTPEEMQTPLALAQNCRCAQWFDCAFDLISKDGGKGPAMREILAQHHLDISQSIAFGDSGNDIDMIRAAGIGVAMENGTPEAKAAADYIAPDCDDDGIVRTLQHFGLL